MEDRILSCSKDWTVLTIACSDKNNPLRLNYFDIEKIQFDEIYLAKLFRKIRTERIHIYTVNNKKPIEITKYYYPRYFDEYKQELSKFARDNRIKLDDNIII